MSRAKVQELLAEIVEHHEPGLMAHDNAQEALRLLGLGPQLRERCDPYLATIRTALKTYSRAQAGNAETSRFGVYAALEDGEPLEALAWLDGLVVATQQLPEGPNRDAVATATAKIRGIVEAEIKVPVKVEGGPRIPSSSTGRFTIVARRPARPS